MGHVYLTSGGASEACCVPGEILSSHRYERHMSGAKNNRFGSFFATIYFLSDLIWLSASPERNER